MVAALAERVVTSIKAELRPITARTVTSAFSTSLTHNDMVNLGESIYRPPNSAQLVGPVMFAMGIFDRDEASGRCCHVRCAPNPEVNWHEDRRGLIASPGA